HEAVLPGDAAGQAGPGGSLGGGTVGRGSTPGGAERVEGGEHDGSTRGESRERHPFLSVPSRTGNRPPVAGARMSPGVEPPLPSPEAADALFEAFLLARDRGEDADVEALCRDHPALADELRALHQAWQEVDAALDRAPRTGSSPRPFHALLDDLRARPPAFSRYVLGDELGRGGMGVVWSVWDEDLQRHLAMKVIRATPADADDEAWARAVARFLEEARITGRLEHPGIPPVHELGIDPDGRLYFTMRRIEGEDLAAVVAKTARHERGWTLVRARG